MTPEPTRPGALEPIVILGGFLSFPRVYRDMCRALNNLTGAPISIVPVGTPAWLRSMTTHGWVHILDALHQNVTEAAASSPSGKVTLVTHSAGGVMARLYLSPAPFQGRTYNGVAHVRQLITLGSPHTGLHPTPMRQTVDDTYPGAYFAPHVNYVSVAGAVTSGDSRGSPGERFAYRAYQRLAGEGAVAGDGLVPVSCALLEGAEQIILPNASHFPIIALNWYGSPSILCDWWPRCQAANEW